MISLFDGETLFGWRANEGGANWSVKDGTITADEGPSDLLCTSVPFADYELDLEFRMAPGGNSGVFLRTDAKPGNVATQCFEVNIVDEHPQGFTTGAIVGRKKTVEPIQGSSDDWRTFHIKANGPHIVITLDGKEVLDYTDEAEVPRLSGLIGLQKNQGKIEFRNITLKPLGMTKLFNGKDLTGWHVAPDSKSKFTVVDGAIHVENGRGFLESDEQYGDFIFQADCRSNAEGLNSGFFYRALKIGEGGNCDGYEVQINNTLVDGDPTKPKDCGTGGIYRRVDARKVVANDNEWFEMTFIPYGSHVSVWVNGTQVTDWTDEREADDNPRRGMRVAPGHISIQGHDPTTDLDFKNLRISAHPTPAAPPLVDSP